MKRYVLDANIYIDADRSAAKAAELEAFYNAISKYLAHFNIDTSRHCSPRAVHRQR